MHIGIVSPSNGFGGGLEKFVWDRARGLTERGHTVRLIHGAQSGRDAARYQEAFASVRVSTDAVALKGIDVALVQRAARCEELRWLGKTPAIVFSHDHDLTCVRSHRYLPLNHSPCHRSPGLGCVANGCVIVRDHARSGRALKVVNPFALKTDTIALSERYMLVACSEYVRERLLDAGVRAERVVAIPSLPAAPTVAVQRVQPARPTLLVIGSLLRGKGVDLAIDALRWLPATVRLRIVGDGPERESLERLAARYEQGRVEFLGAVAPERVEREIDQASIVVVASRWPEPFGMTGLEAMQRGCPVVAARHGGIVEWLRDGEGAEGFAPGNAGSLADATKRLLAEPLASDRAARWAKRYSNFQTSMLQLEQLVQATIVSTKGVNSHEI